MRLKTRDLAIFEAVAKTGTIQAAADEIGMTQSAVTRAIHRLEDVLECQVFDRDHRPIKLTRDGIQALEEAKTVLTAVRQMERTFAGETEPSGPFRLGVPHALTHALFVDEDTLGLVRFPKLLPHITAGWSVELHDKLAIKDLDAVITIDTPRRMFSATATTKMLAESRLCVLAPQHLSDLARNLARANEIGWALSPEGCGYRAALVSALHDLGLTPNIRLETNSVETQLLIASRGQALTLAPHLGNTLIMGRHALSQVMAEGLKQVLTFNLSYSASERRLQPVFDVVQRGVQERLTQNSYSQFAL